MNPTALQFGPGPWSSEQWTQWFFENTDNWRSIPWLLGASLSGAERHAISRSIAAFQLGESSEGKHLLKAAKLYASRSGDLDYERAIRRFIAEEQGHARVLGRFMDLAGIPRIKHTWSDWVFRRLRRGAGLEQSICVLITAELIATIYYAALREATASGLLRKLCDQILDDEAFHIRFQTERINLLRTGQSAWRISLAENLQRILMRGTCRVVWRGHASVLQAGGYEYASFQTACLARLDSILRPRSLLAWSGAIS